MMSNTFAERRRRARRSEDGLVEPMVRIADDLERILVALYFAIVLLVVIAAGTVVAVIKL